MLALFSYRVSILDVKVLANAGGVNPHQCAKILSELAANKGVELKIAVVEGDDLMPKVTRILRETLITITVVIIS